MIRNNQARPTPEGQLEHRYDGIAKVTGKIKHDYNEAAGA